MKNLNRLTFLVALVAAGCSTLSSNPRKTIPFSQVESLKIGKTTKDQIIQSFGKPDEILPYQSKGEVLIYDGVLSNGDKAQKASFSFNKNNALVGVVWIPYETDALHNVKAVQDRFKKVKFISHTKGWDQQGHFYSDDVYYYNEKAGVSFEVNSYHQTVSMIGIGLSSANRNISSQRK